MQKSLLTLLFLSLFLIGNGQKKVENPLTDKHESIAGTKVSVIPPVDFVSATHFLGLQHDESGASIMVIDVPGPYSETSKVITKDQLLVEGIKVEKIESVLLNGFPAKFVTGTQEAFGTEFNKYILVFGTEKETIMIHGACPRKDKKTAKAIEKSILSAYYDENKILNPFDILDYIVDVSGTKLKFGKSMSNSLIFTVDGNVPTLYDDKTSLVTARAFSEIVRNDKKQFAINRLKQLPLTIDNITHIGEIEINELKGYEIEATGRSKELNTEQRIYQVILFRDDIYYILVGTTNDLTDKSINDIKSTVQTFKLK